MKKPLISIITPTYKSRDYIDHTIESVISQTYDNWELIVVDDASMDGIEDYIREKYNDSRIKVFVKNINEGAARARNYAIDNASGDFLAFLDSDDVWDKEKLSKQVNFMMNNNYAFTFTSYMIVDESNLEMNKEVRVPTKIDYEGFLRNTIIGTSTVILNRNLINNPYLVDVRQDHDSMTWLRIMRENNVQAFGLNEILTYYYKRSGSISHNKFKAAKVHWRNLRKFENLSFIKTCVVFIQYGFNAFKKHFSK